MGSIGKGFSSTLTKSEQLDIILNANPAEDDYHTWIRSESDIMTFKEAVDDVGATEYDPYPDYTADMIKRALDTGKITVYSSYPIENGYFVTPSRLEASSYSGNGVVYQATVDTSDVAWIDEGQGQLATRKKIRYSRM